MRTNRLPLVITVVVVCIAVRIIGMEGGFDGLFHRLSIGDDLLIIVAIIALQIIATKRIQRKSRRNPTQED